MLFIRKAVSLVVVLCFLLQITIVNAEVPYKATDIFFGVGSNESQYNFAWFTPASITKGVIQIVNKKELENGKFPSNAFIYTSTISHTLTGEISHKATITDINPKTTYSYRLGDGNDQWTDVFEFTTQDAKKFNFLFISDPQLGASNLKTNTIAWNHFLNKAMSNFPNSSFILSAGDQVDKANSEEQYDAYFSPEKLLRTPSAVVVGNHDDSKLFNDHFHVPNESELGATIAGGDYWFRYGDALFMVFNSNKKIPNSKSFEVEEHAQFMKDAVAENEDAKWRFVVFHHSIYSGGPHSKKNALMGFREGITPYIDGLNIDAVFSGHDHSYVRSYQMFNNAAQKNQNIDKEGRLVNPTGTVYFTANSVTGSKYYDLKRTKDSFYVSKIFQLYVPTFSNVEVTDTLFKVKTYRLDTMEEVDEYTIVKMK